MKNFFLLCFFLLPIAVFCQDKKFHFGMEGSVGQSIYSCASCLTFTSAVTSNSISSGGGVIFEDEALLSSNNAFDIQKSRFAYDFGFTMNRELSDRFAFQTGLKLVAVGNSTRRETSNFEYLNRSFFLEIPIRFNYTLPIKSRSWKISLGQSPTINFANNKTIIHHKVDGAEKEKSKSSIRNLRRINFNTQLGFIWEKQLNTGNTLYVFPNARLQNFGRTTEGTLQDQRFIFYAITTGIRF